jgi:acetoin utilization protein AcuB
MRLEEIGSKQVVTLNPSDSVSRAFKLMVEHNIRHLPIIDEGKTVGIVSDRDLLVIVCWIYAWKSLTKAHTRVGEKQVGELMSSPVSVLSPSDTVEQAVRLMLQGRFGAIPLEREGKIVSIVTETDVLQCYLDDSKINATSSWRDLKVEDHMSNVVITAKPTDHVLPTFRVMQENNIRHLPIVDGDGLEGLISDRDLRRSYGREIAVNLAKDDLDPEVIYHSTLEDAMSRRIETIDRFSTLAQSARRMLDCKIGALPVTAQGKLLGIITETDLLEVLVRECER